MCGRLTLTANIQDIKENFPMVKNSSVVIVPRYNIAPSQLLLIIKDNKFEFLPWGMRLKNNQGVYIINARMETVLEKKLFSHAFQKQRCLIVSSGFFEWRSIGGKKIPYYAQIKNSKVVGFAGIIVDNSCIILTSEASSLKLQLGFHNRMPVIIKNDKYASWLNPKVPALSLIGKDIQLDESNVFMYPVSSQVNNVKIDHITCTQALNL